MGGGATGSKAAAPIRVVIADDHPVYRDGLAQAIEQRPHLELVAKAESGSKALEEIHKLKPDVAVLDTQLRGLDGVEVAQALVRDELPTRVLFLSACLESDTVYRAIESGARGYISKDSAASVICDAVVAVAKGQMALAAETQEAIAERIRVRTTADSVPLSPRELEILSLIADGHAVPEIASHLYLSPSTIRTYIKRLYRKLGVSSRGAAVAEAMRRGLFELALISVAWTEHDLDIALVGGSGFLL